MDLVSIILPTYNSEKFITRAVNSILNQTYKNFELIIVIDGSTDNTEQVLKGFTDSRIKVIKNSNNLGIQKALNNGLRVAKGKHIARIDSDDFWRDVDKLEKQISFLNQNPNYVLVGTGTVAYDTSGKELFRFLSPENDEDIREVILYKNCFTHASVVFRNLKELYNESKEALHVEDYDLWLRLGKQGKFYNLPKYSTGFTSVNSSISNQNKVIQMKKILKISRRYKDHYPGYRFSCIKSYLRLLAYRTVFQILPKKIQNKIFYHYKSN